MKKIVSLFVMSLFVVLSLSSCDKDNDKKDNNPFIGTWIGEGSGGTATVNFTETAWTATVATVVYCSGTYTRNGNSIEMKVTSKGTDSAAIVGDIGRGTVSNGKIVVSNFKDNNMNGNLIKK